MNAREYVLELCRKPDNAFGPSFFDQHLEVVAHYAGRLADRLGADREVVELAAWLHDIAAIRDFSTLAEHAARSAEQARALLAERGYAAPVIERVAQCILTHSTPLHDGTPEQICISNADAMSQIARPDYWMFYAFGVRRFGFEQGREWVRRKFDANRKALIEPAKELLAAG
jgi:uncharacterized protein